jgi:hypothetical protein
LSAPTMEEEAREAAAICWYRDHADDADRLTEARVSDLDRKSRGLGLETLVGIILEKGPYLARQISESSHGDVGYELAERVWNLQHS